MSRLRVMVNQDCTEFFVTRLNHLDMVDEEYLKSFAYQYKDTHVTDFLIDVGGGVGSSIYKSEVSTSASSKYHRTEEFGKSVDYKDSIVKSYYDIFEKKNLDLVAIWVDAFKEIGINPWLTFRMNDAHCHFDLPNLLVSNWFYDHVDEYARVRHISNEGDYRHPYFNRCRDFEIKAVQEKNLERIREGLERYDVDGIELDFMREMWCLRPGREQNLDIMTSFVKEVKALVSEFEAKRNKKIKICIRCAANPQYCLEFGFDISEWARLGLMDIIIPAPRFNTTITDLPVHLWKQLVSRYGVEVGGCIEWQIKEEYRGELVANTTETAIGTANIFHAQQTDAIYLFNYFDSHEEMMVGERRKLTSEKNIKKAEGYYRILTTLGDSDKTIKSDRRTVVSFDESVPLGRKILYAFPMQVREHLPGYIRVMTGTISEKSDTYLRFALQDERNPEDITVFVNCVKAEFVRREPCGEPVVTDKNLYVFKIPNEALTNLAQIAEVYSKEETNIVYADITVKGEK